MPETQAGLEDGPLTPSRTLTVVRTSLVVLAAVGISFAYRAGVFAQLSNPAELARDIVAMGVAGFSFAMLNESKPVDREPGPPEKRARH